MATDFLKAEWRKLLMINYPVNEAILKKYLPTGTEIDLWNGICYVSLVGFMFVNTKLKGIKIPFHINFEEVNLRFYVKYNDNGTLKRGVVFIKEIVPKRMLTFVANTIYHENYETMPMKHCWQQGENKLSIEYAWKKQQWHTIKVKANLNTIKIKADSEEAFITEHYWGYTRLTDKKTSEYEVKHPVWEIYPVTDYTINVDFAKVYGQDFAFLAEQKPLSVFLAEGSKIAVGSGRII